MKPSKPVRAILPSVASLLIGVALAGPAAAQMSHGGHGAAPAAANEPASTREFKAADERMMRAMAVPYTGDADVDFRLHMIPHHEGAIAMAQVALRHAKDDGTRALAEAVIREQEREIGDMKAWLKARGR